MAETHWVDRALEEMQGERDRLSARVRQLDVAIGSVRNLLDLPPLASLSVAAPPNRTPAPVPRRPVPGRSHGSGADMSQAIVAALQRGPMKPGDLAAALNAERANVRHHVKQLEALGLVVSTGTTMSRRIALAPAAAKEAG